MLIGGLKKAGLDEKERHVYLAVLELGEGNIAQITKKSKIKRATVYLALESLVKKGLVSQIIRRKKKIFYAENPKKILDEMENNKKAVEKIIPELLSKMDLSNKKPKIRYFEGKKGVESIYRDNLEYSGQEMLIWLSGEESSLFKNSFFKEVFIPERVKRKIWTRQILPNTEIARKLYSTNQEQLRRSRFMEGDHFKIKVPIALYGKNKISIISSEEELGVIIESKDIHDSLKSIFEAMWSMLKKED